MKKGIHPQYYPEAKVTCACGNSWTVGSTVEELRTDVCNKCHPFFTGQMQRILDRGGQVERFNQRVKTADRLRQQGEEREAARRARERARALVEIVDDEEAEEPIEELFTGEEQE
jgi:large subunit ribosomal protein L31